MQIDQIYFKGLISYLSWYINIPKSSALDIVSETDLENLQSVFEVDLPFYLSKELIDKFKASSVTYPLKPTAFLLGIGFSVKHVDLILKHYSASDSLVKLVQDNPYELLDIEAISFKKVDKIALEIFFFDENFPARIQSSIAYHLHRQCFKKGHLFIYLSEFINSQFEIKIDKNDIKKYLKELILNKKIILEGTKLYPLLHYQAEKESAEIIANLIVIDKNPSFFDGTDPEAFIEGYQNIQTQNIANGKWKKLKWVGNKFELSEQQKDAVKKFIKEKFIIITGLPGTGKCFAENTLVLMYSGEVKKVQDVRVGDLLMGPNSKPRTVLNLSRGYDELFEVIPTKGDSYTINSNHILSLKKSKKMKAYGHLKQGDILNIPLKEYLSKTNSFKGFFKGYHSNAIYYPEQEVSLDPYILGYWLGDGHSYSSRITTQDIEIVSYFENYVKTINSKSLTKHFFKKVEGSNSGKADTYSVTTQVKAEYLRGEYVPQQNRNHMLINLKKYDLLANKHIPLEYKVNSFEVRSKILAGIIDSDGEVSVNSNYTSCTIIMKNKAIIKDIISIAQSLGIAAFYKETYKRCLNCKDTSKKLYHKALLSGDLHRIHTKIHYKKFKKRKQIKNVLNQGITIESRGVGKYYGFSVDKDHLFLLSDYTVVHNSAVSKALVDISKSRNLSVGLMAPTGIAAKRLSSMCDHDAHTIHKILGFDGASWSKNEKSPINYDVIIIDEFSMVDQMLAYRLLKALPRKEFKLVFIGDDAQLGSVAPGNVLRELLNNEHITKIKLDKIFRQEEASDIILNAHLINRGKTNLVSIKKDFVFVESNDIDNSLSLIVKIVDKLKDKNYQVLSPTYQGGLGVLNINHTLQDILNPSYDNLFFKTDKFKFRVDDKIMIIKNDYQNYVYNGEQGILVGINHKRKILEIYINGRTFEYSFYDAYSMISMDYARTVHKCINVNSYIPTEKGLLNFEEIMQEWGITNFNEDFTKENFKIKLQGMFGIRETSEIFRKNKINSLKIKTELGYRLESTENHPIMILNKDGNFEWRKSGDLKKDDLVLIKKGFEIFPKNPTIIPKPEGNKISKRKKIKFSSEKINKDVAWLLGLIVGDGCYSSKKDHTIEIAIKGESLIAEVERVVKENFNAECKVYRYGEKCPKLHITRKTLREVFYEMGLDYITHKDKVVPLDIRKSNPGIMSSFLSGLFDSDGGVNHSGIHFTTTSYNLAVQVSTMLLYFKIVSSFKDMGSNAYRILIQGEDSRIFMKKIGFRDKGRLINWIKSGHEDRGYIKPKSNISFVPNGDILAKNLRDKLKEGKPHTNRYLNDLPNYKKAVEILGYAINGTYRLSTYHIDFLEKYIPDKNIKEWQELAKFQGFLIDTIKELEKSQCDVFDFVVPNGHDFVSNGFISHNSQGQEYDFIILPWILDFTIQLQRNLLYTAITRAKKKVFIIGEKKALDKAIKNNRISKRNTIFSSRISTSLNKLQQEQQ